MSDVQGNHAKGGTSTVWQVIGRLVAAAVVLAITAFFTPGFTINNIWTLAIAAIVLTVIDYLVIKFTGLHASPFGKGFVGFALAAIILYVTKPYKRVNLLKSQHHFAVASISLMRFSWLTLEALAS